MCSFSPVLESAPTNELPTWQQRSMSWSTLGDSCLSRKKGGLCGRGGLNENPQMYIIVYIRTQTFYIVLVHNWCSAQGACTRPVRCSEDDAAGLCISGFSKERVQVRLDLGGQQWRARR